MNDKKIISFYHAAHDANVSVYSEKNDFLYTIELERILGIRYLEESIPIIYFDYVLEYIKNILKNLGFDENFDEAYFIRQSCEENYQDDYLSVNVEKIKNHFNIKNIRFFNHHETHAATGFYSSEFEESLIISYDGIGNDGNFAVFEASLKSGIKKINEYTTTPLTLFYSFIGNYIEEISKNNFNKNYLNQTIAGKLMGLSAYGKYDENIYYKFYEYLSNKYNSSDKGVIPDSFVFEGLHNILNTKKSQFSYQEQLNLAYNIQLAFENYFIDLFKIFFNPIKYSNVCLVGGGALNVLLNEKLSKMFPNTKFYVPPNPNDSGLSFGCLCLGLNKKIKHEIMYSGVPILDSEFLPNILMYRGSEEATPKLIANELYNGKIIGVCRNGSEVGPRALGNRSILANPCLFNIKDDLNKKVKFREWFRPFAPICIEEQADKYFEISKNVSYKYMSFAPKVREEHRMYLPSITHIDGTSRLQTINRKQNEYIYDILKEFEKLSGYPILVNTSFNIRGKPILTHYQAALQNLDSTQMDGVVLDNYYIKKDL